MTDSAASTVIKHELSCHLNVIKKTWQDIRGLRRPGTTNKTAKDL